MGRKPTPSEYQRLPKAALDLTEVLPNLRQDRDAAWWYVYFAARGDAISPQRAIAFAERIDHEGGDAGQILGAIQTSESMSAVTLEEIRQKTGLADRLIHMALLVLQRSDLLLIEDHGAEIRYAIGAPHVRLDP